MTQFLLTASIAFLAIFALSQAYWRVVLRRAAKSPADLPGGGRAFVRYHLAQAVTYALALAYIAVPLTQYGFDWSNRLLWRDFAIVLGYSVMFIATTVCLARRYWPSYKRIDAALAALRKTGRTEPLAK